VSEVKQNIQLQNEKEKKKGLLSFSHIASKN